jgi:hypothetical protein
MRRTWCCAALALVMFLTPMSAQQSSATFPIETRYDRTTDTTTRLCHNLVRWGEAPAGVTFEAYVSFHGRQANDTAQCGFLLFSNRSRKAKEPQFLFKTAQSLILKSDDLQIELPVKNYHSEYFELINSAAESAGAELSHKDLPRLLAARNLVGKWGNVEFRLSEASLNALRRFLSYQPHQ